MGDRPAAPGPRPPGEPPRRERQPDPRFDDDDDDGDLGVEDETGELPDELFDREWPDDDEEPVPVEEPGSEPDELPAAPPLDAEDEDDSVLEDASHDVDELEDLVAADDTDIPVIDAELSVRVDGRALPARVDWTRAVTVWVRPAGGGPDREVTLEIAGRRLPAVVQVLAGDQEVILLGRDLLKGRFLLRV
jgi:hypothetical protein